MGATFMFSMKMELPPAEDEEEIKQQNIVEEKVETSQSYKKSSRTKRNKNNSISDLIDQSQIALSSDEVES